MPNPNRTVGPNDIDPTSVERFELNARGYTRDKVREVLADVLDVDNLVEQGIRVKVPHQGDNAACRIEVDAGTDAVVDILRDKGFDAYRKPDGRFSSGMDPHRVLVDDLEAPIEEGDG